jgi:hypothetical protein
MTATATAKHKPVPAHIAARVEELKADIAEANAKKASRKARVKSFIEAEGIALRHFRLGVRTPLASLRSHNGGISVAWREKSSNTFIEVATAICRQDEGFNHKLGTLVAVEQFIAGHVIRVPTFGLPGKEVVEAMFGGLVTADLDTVLLD